MVEGNTKTVSSTNKQIQENMEAFASHLISYGLGLVLFALCIYMAYSDYRSTKRLESGIASMMAKTDAILDSLEDDVDQLDEARYQAFKEANTPNA